MYILITALTNSVILLQHSLQQIRFCMYAIPKSVEMHHKFPCFYAKIYMSLSSCFSCSPVFNDEPMLREQWCKTDHAKALSQVVSWLHFAASESR